MPIIAKSTAHVQILGFQGSDPATDLRGSGMLALGQMLQLHAYNRDNAAVIFQASQHPDRVRCVLNCAEVLHVVLVMLLDGMPVPGRCCSANHDADDIKTSLCHACTFTKCAHLSASVPTCQRDNQLCSAFTQSGLPTR